MVVIKQVSKYFKSKTALDSVSFTAVSGEVTGVIGANGSGKTTIMRLISTVMAPSGGSISVCGFDTVKRPVEVRKHIGVLLGGDVSLYGKFTAYENIEYFAKLQGMDKPAIKRNINELTELLNMNDYINRRVEKFSRGMKQRVAFARAIVHDPDVLLLDEPSTGLDIYSIHDVQEFIFTCKKRGKTILLSTHNINEMENLCDRIVLLDQGRKAAEGSKAELLTASRQNNIMDMFFSTVDSNGGCKK